MIDRLHEIKFDPDGKAYAQISLANGNPYLVEEVEVSGVIMKDNDKALLIRVIEIAGVEGRTLHPVKIVGDQALEWLSSRFPLVSEICSGLFPHQAGDSAMTESQRTSVIKSRMPSST